MSSPKNEVFEIISKQTGIDDVLLIEKTYYSCGSDTSKTILTLLNIDIPLQRHEKIEQEKTVFDDLRQILEEKDAIFHSVMNKAMQAPCVSKTT